MSYLLDILICTVYVNTTISIRYSKWDKKLPLHLTINIYKTFLYFLIALKTTIISKKFTVQALVNFRVMDVFIYYSLICYSMLGH